MGSQEPCIYSVPSQLREARPEAYKPRMLLIGPLHHSEKPKAHKGNADSRYVKHTHTKFLAQNNFESFFFFLFPQRFYHTMELYIR